MQVKLKNIIKRALIAYLGGLGTIGVVLAISIGHGSGWRPALAGLPLYVTIFAGITYQLFKEVRALKREEQQESKQ
ncbi:hypothetical protein DXT88_20385 [Herbaspirillum lusitanum]|uniref:hypothetical protein n=1 Tax=Herbaspirillum lusitanum TaxID=213312 RepID=UPI002238D2D8|nr:hypothetical protein [Herbaspirillum lusitanum]MCW5300532.1 hypothetical protein [Herbaspirillum lusitanum]